MRKDEKGNIYHTKESRKHEPPASPWFWFILAAILSAILVIVPTLLRGNFFSIHQWFVANHLAKLVDILLDWQPLLIGVFFGLIATTIKVWWIPKYTRSKAKYYKQWYCETHKCFFFEV
ncbi:hypothetical protein GETHLI_32530 [Geothrix limicola]|uniref:Uncharacterized protein n=2 Tax=Geothrix limicola TaxID=2927978 RepID=A0ABQ5QK60_9BACT|nr:hypothetical protein GETHLI_32530 [Geothrix limicola]